MRQVFYAMGMPISVEIRGKVNSCIFLELEKHFVSVERKFSPFNDSTELSKYNKDNSVKLSKEFAEVKSACEYYEKYTNGYFSPYFDGVSYNPTGFVKAWSINKASKLLLKNSNREFFINAGGDILARSESTAWQIGIQHPVQRQSIIGSIRANNFSVATSGYYEKGLHIINPITKKNDLFLTSVTVIGPEIEKADVLATALMAMGSDGPDFINNISDYSAIFIDRDLNVITSSDLNLKI